VGDLVGVGCMVDSCQTCSSCKQDLEQFCENGYSNSPDKHLEGKQTYGGYSTSVVVDEKFVLRIPENLDEASNRTAIMRRSYYMVTTSLERKKEIK
jgi:uncharacterized zinc-type alcohol dehydrogenase-like protein